MNLQVIGCSHHQADVMIREQLAFTEQQIKPFLGEFYQRFPQSEAVLLSTCNRTEFYAAGKNPDVIPSQHEMIDFLATYRGLSPNAIADSLFVHRDRQAIGHLFSVASSLDSMVVGEPQILSQVKKAYQLAVETNESIPVTHHVFQSAIRVARRVSNETKIHSNRVSVPSVAIGVLAKQIFERLNNKNILIIGAGEMAEETLRYVKAEGGQKICVINRSPDKARHLADQFGGRTADWSDLKNELVASDLIVSTTGATEPVVTAELFDGVVGSRQQKPLFILDLAVPRDFDSQIGDRLNVYLYTLDDLQKVCERNRKARQNHFAKAQTILEQETELFVAQLNHRSAGTTIARLRQQADAIKQAEFKRLMNKLDLEPEQQRQIEQSFHRLVNKILHPPLKSVRQDTGETHHGLLDALKRLFELED